jgi:hypothetical protein
MKILPIICGLLLITGCAIGGSLPVSPPQIVSSPDTLTVTNSADVRENQCSAWYLTNTATDFPTFAVTNSSQFFSTNWTPLGTNSIAAPDNLVTDFSITNVPVGSLLTAQSGDGTNWSFGNPIIVTTNILTPNTTVIAPPVIGDK